MGRRSEHSNLCYIDASRVQSPAGELGALGVLDRNDCRIGTVEGVLVDPVQRRLRFLVVESDSHRGSRHLLVPSDTPTVVDENAKSVRVELDSDELAEFDDFDPRRVRQFSDDDVIAAMFRQPAA